MDTKFTICYFGSFAPEYSRNKILIDGLKKNGTEALLVADSSSSFLVRYPKLTGKFWTVRKQVSVIVVGFRGHLDMPLAFLLGKLTGKKVIFDAFISIYDTYLHDRRIFSKYSLPAVFYYLIDWLACALADHIILDTNAQIDFFVQTFLIPKRKFSRVFVGGDDTIFRPVKRRPRQKVVIEWHGIFTRLHGLETVLEAAKLLENNPNVEFLIIGDNPHFQISEGARYLLHEGKPKNVQWLKRLPVEQLARNVANADITIGHFGTTEKALNVLTNKIFHGLATGNAVIVEDSSASRELFVDGKNCLFARPGNAKDLAEKMSRLAEDSQLRDRIARAGHTLFQMQLTNEKLGKEFKLIIQRN